MAGKMVPERVEVTPGRPCPTVLVVDDEPAIASLLADLLELDGYRVTTAPNGLAALDRLQAGGFDAIVSDVRMPELDGPGLYREVERLDPSLAQRMVFVTGNMLTDDTADFFAATGAPCLRKPFAQGDVQRVLRQVLAASR
ncbi:MAG: response regulator [Candidatus Rokubacteria bacterium]|nr:response regulator [Candidatus Rokubacteria bacterium]